MKRPAATSPFAALTHQEQRHQWTVWHAEQDATRPVESEGERIQVLPERREEAPQPAAQPTQTVPAQPQPIYHSQYDAVIRRMRNAGRQTQQFVSVASALEQSTTQPESGNP